MIPRWAAALAWAVAVLPPTVHAQVPAHATDTTGAAHAEAMDGGGAFAGIVAGTHRGPLDASMPGLHVRRAAWSAMLHGHVALVARRDPPPRGARALFHTSTLMASARRALGPGWVELQAMVSADPLLGPSGYPLLLQTGETADGVTPLVDRQHPHDALMAVSASYRAPIDEGVWAFAYVAPIGSPALGPVPFMHRASAGANPTAPITHHFLDATHIAHGVASAGVLSERVQIEASIFNGREPDRRRWTPDAPALNSFSGRITVTPGRSWALQASFGDLSEPERLHPGIDVHRATLSVSHERAFGRLGTATTLAWGRNVRQETTMSLGEARARLPGPLLDHYLATSPLPPDADDSLLLLFPRRTQSGWLAETALAWGGTTATLRLERASKDELFPPSDLRHSTAYRVGKLDVGVVHDVRLGSLTVGAGAAASFHQLPAELRDAYGEDPRSWMLLVRLKL